MTGRQQRSREQSPRAMYQDSPVGPSVCLMHRWRRTAGLGVHREGGPKRAGQTHARARADAQINTTTCNAVHMPGPWSGRRLQWSRISGPHSSRGAHRRSRPHLRNTWGPDVKMQRQSTRCLTEGGAPGNVCSAPGGTDRAPPLTLTNRRVAPQTRPHSCPSGPCPLQLRARGKERCCAPEAAH